MSYSSEQQQLLREYFAQLSSNEIIAYKIAFEHLESSFNIYRSNGFVEWLKQKKINK
jgi:hypothetical protein